MLISGSTSRLKKALPLAFAACLFLLVVTARWMTFDRYGSAMPDWDQWDAEAMGTLVPWFTHDDFITHLLTPHNEHRVVLTKLQALALVLLNGQWDARLEAVTNALLPALLAATAWLLSLRCFAAQSSEQRGVSSEHHASKPPLAAIRYPLLAARYVLPVALFLLTFCLYALPVAWQNVLAGFHSQQFWLVALSCAALLTLPFARPFSRSWWLGAVSSFLALGSMASGFLSAVAVAIVIGFRLARRQTTLRAAAPALAVALVTTAIGILTRYEAPNHADLKAQSVHDFVFTIIHSLQWPWRDQHWAALVLWLPWLLLAWRVLRLPHPSVSPAPTRVPQSILALGGWVLLQLAATAYARGVGADYPASRYMDTLAIGALANAFALAWLLRSQRTGDEGLETRDLDPSTHARSPHRLRRPAPFTLTFTLTLAWLATLAFGLHRYLTHVVRIELQDIKKYHLKAEGHMRAYLATDDPQHLAHPDIPFPSAEGLIERLAFPSLRALMPAPIRKPLDLAPATTPDTSAAAFIPNNAIGAPRDRPPRHGLTAATPPLDYTVTWGSHDAARGPAFEAQWRSAPLTAPLGAWLKFETAGDLGRPSANVSLQLLDAATGAVLADIRPSLIPGNSWRSAYARAPDRPFIVAATDASPHHWLAFSPPVEMGRLSFWAWQATKHARVLFNATLGLTVALAFIALIAHRRTRASTPAASSLPPAAAARSP